MSELQTATAFAPASVGNVAVGFDILGHALESVGDFVTVRRLARPGVQIKEIRGVVKDLPLSLERNTAGVAVDSLLRARKADFGLEIIIDKGIPMGSGMGGSAASAVAGVVAANAMFATQLPLVELLPHALAGEEVASGAHHADNVAPCLLGGLLLAGLGRQPTVHRIPVPEGLCCVLLYPHRTLETRAGRALLQARYPLEDVVAQTSRLAGFITACFLNDRELLANSLEDVLIEPQRAKALPGFHQMKAAALENGALGCSLSGSGPSLFAWADTAHAQGIAEAMVQACQASGTQSNVWISPVDARGARLVADARQS